MQVLPRIIPALFVVVGASALAVDGLAAQWTHSDQCQRNDSFVGQNGLAPGLESCQYGGDYNQDEEGYQWAVKFYNANARGTYCLSYGLLGHEAKWRTCVRPREKTDGTRLGFTDSASPPGLWVTNVERIF